jgi:hypothetical protein
MESESLMAISMILLITLTLISVICLNFYPRTSIFILILGFLPIFTLAGTLIIIENSEHEVFRTLDVKVVKVGDQQVINFKDQLGNVQSINLTQKYHKIFDESVNVTEYKRDFWFIKRTFPVTVTNPFREE